MEQVPFVGTSGVRKAQHDQVKVAANKVVDALKNTRLMMWTLKV